MTVDELSRQIEADLDWRLEELAIFRELLVLDTVTATRRAALFRAAWALLYAHYEGFCKYALQLLANYMRSLPNCNNIAHATFLFLHEKAIKAARDLSAAEVYDFFRTKIDLMRADPPPEVAIDTKSNLWPALLEELLVALDLSDYDVIEGRDKIRTLVARRNDIAHGQKVFIKDASYYAEYENATRNLMYALALAIVDRASKY